MGLLVPGHRLLSTLPLAHHCYRRSRGGGGIGNISLRFSSSSSSRIMMAQGEDGGIKAPPAASSVIQFLTLCQRLKTTKRTGWLNRDVQNAESIADHMHRMAIMALIAADLPGIDRDRCVKMAVVHDIAEAIVGDITPADGVPKEEKNRRESAAIDEMCNILENGQAASEIKELWNEYESNVSPEAKLVKDLDKVEMILQALEYETAQDKELDDFFMSTAGKFQTDIGKAWAAEIVSRRNQRIKQQVERAAAT